MARSERVVAFLRQHKRLSGALIALVATAVAVALWPAASAPTDSGLQGRVWLGPLSPVQHVGANERPYSATLKVLGPDNRVVATVRSNQDGHFRVDLAQGAYVLQGVSGSNGFPHANPLSVVVAAHRFTQAQVSFDTGIR
jgi:hypothetical protein